MVMQPIPLNGEWDEGWALSQHTIHSIPIGEDVFGRMESDTKRTELGELLYLFKYRHRSDVLKDIIALISPFLDRWDKLNEINSIIPVPPTNKNRVYQPTFEIAQAIAEYCNKGYNADVLANRSTVEAKNQTSSQRQIIATLHAKRTANILLIDDIYYTGDTLNECVRELRKDKNINKIYVLTMTITKRRR